METNQQPQMACLCSWIRLHQGLCSYTCHNTSQLKNIYSKTQPAACPVKQTHAKNPWLRHELDCSASWLLLGFLISHLFGSFLTCRRACGPWDSPQTGSSSPSSAAVDWDRCRPCSPGLRMAKAWGISFFGNGCSMVGSQSVWNSQLIAVVRSDQGFTRMPEEQISHTSSLESSFHAPVRPKQVLWPTCKWSSKAGA